MGENMPTCLHQPDYDSNRRRLLSLIDTTPYFTRQDLVEKYREGHSESELMLIHPVMTIPNFLMQLREAGVLGYQAGLYYHSSANRND